MLRCVLTAALVIVKEVANHANDIMKQGVSGDQMCTLLYIPSHTQPLLCMSTERFADMHFCFFHQDNFQKLIQVQCSLNGHHEIVQPGRVCTIYEADAFIAFFKFFRSMSLMSR